MGKSTQTGNLNCNWQIVGEVQYEQVCELKVLGGLSHRGNTIFLWVVPPGAQTGSHSKN